MTSAFKNLLHVKEVPFPPLLLITDEVNSTSASTVSKILLDKLIAEGSYSIHCVHGSLFDNSLSGSNGVTHYHPTFTSYGEDSTAFDNFMTNYRNNHPRKTQKPIPQFFNVSSNAFEQYDNTLLEKTELALQNHSINEKKEDAPKTLVVVDRVEDILLHTTARHILLSCKEVIAGGGMVILVCSSSIVLPSTLQHLKYAASSVVALSSAEGSSQSCQWNGIADVVIRRPSGKIIKSREFYHIEAKSKAISTAVAPPPSNLSFTTLPIAEHSSEEQTTISKSSFTKNAFEGRSEPRHAEKGAPKISLKSPTSATDATEGSSRMTTVGDASEGDREQHAINALVSQATFNLKLSDEERRAKNNLLLPHQRMQHASGGGVVLYTPDSEDWDEEDPDDDLDI